MFEFNEEEELVIAKPLLEFEKFAASLLSRTGVSPYQALVGVFEQ